MIPRFRLERPRTIGDAFEAFARADGDGAYLAGGTELLQVMKMGLMQVGTLIDIKALDELRGIRTGDDGALVIGALTTHREIERSPLVERHAPGLAALARRVANVRVRATGTLGGNLAFAEPHSDPATYLLASDARVELAAPGARRSLAIDAFLTGPLSTAREPEELLTSIWIPATPTGTGRAYARIAFFERPAASVAVSASVVDGAVTAAVVAVGSLVDTPARVDLDGSGLVGIRVAEIEAHIAGIAAGLAERIDAYPDLNGSADYKRHLAAGLIRGATVRAVHSAVAA